ncbi:MAG TPA: LysR family transcriptional regulator [Acetobacteraceae bacterium]|nr:LysR family transcriptional regulator [Acetobacteraceae bacterium]
MPDIGDPTLDQLRVLAAIADTGSFSAAARKLKRAQSVISYTMTNLEAQLGVALFDRGGRTPALTEAGQALLADARRVAQGVDEMRARAMALRQGTEASVSLAVDVMFPVARLTCVLRVFADTYPTVALRLRMEAVGGVAHLVTDGECRLGLSGWAGNLGDVLRAEAVGSLRLVPVAAPSHPLAAMAEVPPGGTREHTQLVLTDASRLTDGQDFGVLSLRTWRLGDLGAKHALLLAGFGWGNMPEHLVEDDIAAGRLKRLRLAEMPHTPYTLILLRRADVRLGPAAAWLWDRLRSSVAAPSREAAGGRQSDAYQ